MLVWERERKRERERWRERELLQMYTDDSKTNSDDKRTRHCCAHKVIYNPKKYRVALHQT